MSTLLKSVCVSVRPSVYPITPEKFERLTKIFLSQVRLINISVEFEDEKDRLPNGGDILNIQKVHPMSPEGEYRDFKKNIFWSHIICRSPFHDNNYVLNSCPKEITFAPKVPSDWVPIGLQVLYSGGIHRSSCPI